MLKHQNKISGRVLLGIAIILALVIHGATYLFTFEKTYDAYVHIFFSSHYAESWFSSWNPKWYTGFTVTSYPPLVHQAVALMSKLVGLKPAFYIWTLILLVFLIRGVYKWSSIWVSELAAGYAAICTVFCGAIVEALHLFGQIPSLTGAAFLLNATYEIYKWGMTKSKRHLLLGSAFIACTTAAHHVTTIFGTVFFVFPVLATILIDKATLQKENLSDIRLRDIFDSFKAYFLRFALLGVIILCLVVVSIFAYWFWSFTDPINQVSIPHGSRADFLSEINLGLIFFVIPWSFILLILPYIFIRMLSRRQIALGLAFFLLFILGTGGTTPIPKLLLGENAFNILTLDRFTFWAVLLSLPFVGEFIHRLFLGDFRQYLDNKASWIRISLQGLILIAALTSTIGIINLGNVRPFQPESIDIKPIKNFLESDQHNKWRYLTLGFGDQMAWLSANTSAQTVDGNYHSVRRLPEFTTRAVERLENAKYSGNAGLNALHDFLRDPEKFHLKYVFCNDKFYEPLLHFYGWTWLPKLENGLSVWEKVNVTPLPLINEVKQCPTYMRLMWGILPMTFLAFLILLLFFNRNREIPKTNIAQLKAWNTIRWAILIGWLIILMILSVWILRSVYLEHIDQSNPKTVVLDYLDNLDFKLFDEAYTYIHQESDLSQAQFIKAFGLEESIAHAYASLDNTSIEIEHQSEEHCTAHTIIEWLTATGSFTEYHQYQLKTDLNGKWKILFDKLNAKSPPDQFYSMPAVAFRNQGRRDDTSVKTNRKDVLDRPILSYHSCQLIQKDSAHYIVGVIENVDAAPANIDIDVRVINQDQEYKIAVDMISKRWLLPNESTPFKIVIDPTIIIDKDSRVVVSAATSVASIPQYRYYGIQNWTCSDARCSGDIYNFGDKEVSIAQLLVGEYHNDTLIDVSSHFLPEGIRPGRSKQINLSLNAKPGIILSQPTCIVNGQVTNPINHTNGYNGFKPSVFAYQNPYQ